MPLRKHNIIEGMVNGRMRRHGKVGCRQKEQENVLSTSGKRGQYVEVDVWQAFCSKDEKKETSH